MWQNDVPFSRRLVARESGDEAGFQLKRLECFLVHDGMRQQKQHFDPDMAQLYQHLSGIFVGQS